MKRLSILLVVALVLASAAWAPAVLAGCGSCGAGNAKAAGSGDTKAHSGHGEMKSHMDHEGTATSGEMAEHSAVDLHHGQVTEAAGHHFETVMSPDGIRLYLYAANGIPMKASGLKGKAVVTPAGGESQTIELAPAEPKKDDTTAYFCPGHAQATQMKPGICTACGTMELIPQNYLEGKADFSSFGKGAKVQVLVENLKGSDGPVAFNQEFALAVKGEAGASGAHDKGGHEGHAH